MRDRRGLRHTNEEHQAGFTGEEHGAGCHKRGARGGASTDEEHGVDSWLVVDLTYQALGEDV